MLSKAELKRVISAVPEPEDDNVGKWVVAVAIAVEAEVRAQETALIRRLVKALEGHQGNYKLTAREAEPVNDAITAGRARLKEITP